MKYLLTLILLAVAPLSPAKQHVLLIQGAAGGPEFEEGFSKAAELWRNLAKQADADFTLVSPKNAGDASKKRIHAWIASPERRQASSLWIAYLGHGTYNAGGAKLNLPGDDLSASELAEWLADTKEELVFVHGGSASSPFLSKLAGENRVIITATRSPTELNYARFGEFFAQALASEASDIDRDASVSLLEAFLSASAATETFYKEAGRLSSEHALIDDNGDGKGTPASQFSGLRLIPKAQAPASEGRFARNLSLSPQLSRVDLSPAQREERHRLETELELLYSKKEYLSEDEYFDKLEGILSQLSQFYLPHDES